MLKFLTPLPPPPKRLFLWMADGPLPNGLDKKGSWAILWSQRTFLSLIADRILMFLIRLKHKTKKWIISDGCSLQVIFKQIKHFLFTLWSLEITELRSFFLTSLHKQRTIEEIEHTVFRKDWSHMVFQPLFRKSSEIKSYSGMHYTHTEHQGIANPEV